VYTHHLRNAYHAKSFESFRVVDTVIMGHEKLWKIKAERDRI
jgi:hypothetical protein